MFLGADADRPFWEGSEELILQGKRIRSLNASDLLLHVCIHGAFWNPMAPVRWIPDAYMLLTSEKAEICWDRLGNLAEQRSLAQPLANCLRVLEELLEVSISQDLLRRLDKSPGSVSSRLYHAFWARKPVPLIGKICRRYSEYLWVRKDLRRENSFTFPKYLRYFWGVESVLALIKHGAKELLADFKGLLSSTR